MREEILPRKIHFADAAVGLAVRDDGALVLTSNGDDSPVDVSSLEGLAVAVVALREGGYPTMTPPRLRALCLVVYPDSLGWDWASVGRPGRPSVSPEHPIVRARQARGWTQARLADHLGVATSTVRAWENGSRQPSGPARRLLAELGISL